MQKPVNGSSGQYKLKTKFEYQCLVREMINNKRHYILPDASAVPSVTTILSATQSAEKAEGLANWAAAVGQYNATQICTEAANRGTRMHSYLEKFILNDEFPPYPSNPFAQPSWYMAAEIALKGLVNVTEFWGVEVPVYYPGLYAGTSDVIGTWKGKPAIMDFKQSNKVKKRENIGDYFIQLAAYAAGHNFVHNTAIETGVILMCVKPATEALILMEPEYLEFEVGPEEFQHWTNEWFKRVDLYYSNI